MRMIHYGLDHHNNYHQQLLYHHHHRQFCFSSFLNGVSILLDLLVTAYSGFPKVYCRTCMVTRWLDQTLNSISSSSTQFHQWLQLQQLSTPLVM